MPVLLAPVIATAIGVTATTATIIANVLVAAVSIGAQYLLAARQPKNQRQPMQSILRQPSAPRFRSYGRVRTSGVVYFYYNRGPHFGIGVAVGSGKVDAIEEYLTGTEVLTVSGVGAVTSGKLAGWAVLRWNDGDDNQTASPLLGGYFPDMVTPAHRLRGIPNIDVLLTRPGKEDRAAVYPQGIPQNWRVTYRGARVWDPRDGAQAPGTAAGYVWYHGTWKWSDNPALCILDYLRCPDGARVPLEWIDVDSFKAAADLCDVLVQTNATGGTEKRYRLWGIYQFDEEARAVLARMLNTCDGELYVRQDGKIALRLGHWIEPSVVLTDEHIIECAYEQANSRLSAVNEVRVKFTSPSQDYQLVEGPTVRDAASIAALGVTLSEEVAFGMVPSGTQAHRLGVRHLRRNNPPSKLSLTVNAFGLMVIGEPVVRVTFAALGLNGVYQVQGLEVGSDLATVKLDLSEVTPSTFAEVYPPVDPDLSISDPTPDDIPVPANLAATPVKIITSNGTTIYLAGTVTTPSDTSLGVEYQYRLQGTATWLPYDVANGSYEGRSGPIAEEQTYETRARFVEPSGAPGTWTALVQTKVGAGQILYETQAYLARMPVKPSDARTLVIDRFIQRLKDGGIWGKLDAIYLLAAHDAATARLNLKGSNYTLTANGGLTFTADRGYTGNGTNGWLGTGFRPSIANGKLQRNSAHIGAWVLTDGLSNSGEIGRSEVTSVDLSLFARNASGSLLARLNDVTYITAANIGDARGHSIGNRSGAAARELFKNGAQVATDTVASTMWSDKELAALRQSSAYSAREMAAWHFGGSLTATEAAALYAALNEYLVALGAA